MVSEVLALHSRKVAIAEHELDAGLGARSQSDEYLVLANLLLVFLVTASEGGASDLLASQELVGGRFLLMGDLLVEQVDPCVEFLMDLY